MLKEVRVRCPGCQKEFVVDTRTGQVLREVDRSEPTEEIFDSALEKVKEQQETSENRFLDALKSEEGRQSRLEDAFDEARKRAKEKPDEKPYNPMDYD